MIDPNNFVEEIKGIKVNPLYDVKSCIEDEISPIKESDYMENYKPFISEVAVSLAGDDCSSQKVKILRDTRSTQSLMLESVLPLTDNSFTGANVLISGVEMGLLEVLLHEVNKFQFNKWQHCNSMRPSLPVDPRVVEKPRDDDFPGIFPASVVTRSIKRQRRKP